MVLGMKHCRTNATPKVGVSSSPIEGSGQQTQICCISSSCDLMDRARCSDVEHLGFLFRLVGPSEPTAGQALELYPILTLAGAAARIPRLQPMPLFATTYSSSSCAPSWLSSLSPRTTPTRTSLR